MATRSGGSLSAAMSAAALLSLPLSVVVRVFVVGVQRRQAGGGSDVGRLRRSAVGVAIFRGRSAREAGCCHP